MAGGQRCHGAAGQTGAAGDEVQSWLAGTVGKGCGPAARVRACGVAISAALSLLCACCCYRPTTIAPQQARQ
jgi:hypothetical protein